MTQHGNVLIALNRAKIARDWQAVQQCAICAKTINLSRPVCPECAKGLV